MYVIKNLYSGYTENFWNSTITKANQKKGNVWTDVLAMKTYGWQISTLKHAHHHWIMLLSHFSRVRFCETPEMAAHQAPLALGFSRQEHWSGLPFPSPMHEREKWKWSCSVVSNSSRPHGLQPTRLLCPWDFPGKSTGVGCHCLLRLDHKGNANHTTRTHCCLHTRMTTIKKKNNWPSDCIKCW